MGVHHSEWWPSFYLTPSIGFAKGVHSSTTSSLLLPYASWLCQRCTLFHYSESPSPLCLLALPKVYSLPLLRVSFLLTPIGFAKGVLFFRIAPSGARLGLQGRPRSLTKRLHPRRCISGRHQISFTSSPATVTGASFDDQLSPATTRSSFNR